MAQERKPLVSIPLTTFNGEKYLELQLESIFSQDYRPLEVIACDDCSTDRTPGILDKYHQSHGLKVFRNDRNLGYLRNFERAVSLCTGELIAPADQDDIWLPEKIALLVDHIGNNSLVFSGLHVIGPSGELIENSAETYSWLAPRSGKPFFQLLFNPFVIGCTSMFRRSLLEKAFPIPEGEKYHDYWISIIASIMDGIQYVQTPLVRYRQHGANSLGLKKRGSFFRFLFKWFESKPEIKIQAERLSMLIRQPCFSPEHRRDIGIAKAYFEDRLKPGLHIHAFLIALRHARSVFPGVSPIVRVKSIVGTLIR